MVEQDVPESWLPQQGVEGQLAVGTTQVGQQGVKGVISGGKDLVDWGCWGCWGGGVCVRVVLALSHQCWHNCAR